MEKPTVQPFSAGDHTEALTRTTTFDDGASHKMKAIRHEVLITPAGLVALVGLTGGDSSHGVAY